MKTVIILSGIPCSGKTYSIADIVNYYGQENIEYIKVLSKDYIRNKHNLKSYNHEDESKVTEIYEKCIEETMLDDKIAIVILDNTHCSNKQITKLINRFKDDNKLKVIFYDCSLIKAYCRNIYRWLFDDCDLTPFSFINRMYKSYKKINKEQYEQLILDYN